MILIFQSPDVYLQPGWVEGKMRVLVQFDLDICVLKVKVKLHQNSQRACLNGTRGALLLFCWYHVLRLELTHWLSAGEAEGA